MTQQPETVEIRSGEHLVFVRQAVRAKAEQLKLSLVDQTRIITAASELARNTLEHGGGGIVTIQIVENGTRRGLRLKFEDKGPGHYGYRPRHEGRIFGRDWSWAWPRWLQATR